MDIVFVLLPLSLLLAVVGLAGFLWASKTRQFDNLDSEAIKVVFEDLEAASTPRSHESLGATPQLPRSIPGDNDRDPEGPR